MSKVTVEAFLSVPICAGGVVVRRHLERLRQEFGDRVEIITHHGRCGELEMQNITSVPALVIGNLIKFVGLAPKYEDLVTALHKAGLE